MFLCYFVSLTRLHLTLRLHKSPLGGKGRVPKREGTGSPYKQLQGIFQHLCRKVLQGERNTCDRNQYTWAFSIDFRTGYHRPFVSPCPWHTNPHHFTLLLILEILNFNWKGPPSKKITKIKVQMIQSKTIWCYLKIAFPHLKIAFSQIGGLEKTLFWGLAVFFFKPNIAKTKVFKSKNMEKTYICD